jgi:hypothetical protein
MTSLISFSMIEMKSCLSCAIDKNQSTGADRLSPSSALLAILGLSFLGWAVILAPLVAVLDK